MSRPGSTYRAARTLLGLNDLLNILLCFSESLSLSNRSYNQVLFKTMVLCPSDYKSSHKPYYFADVHTTDK
ncbi:hypothetical protein F5Y07DRAFT_352405 [Xylaria sp. FL0933]|nr:hypothetical protein F5Y07DRAFT_352405 [Xylaria sp. FL0933]